MPAINSKTINWLTACLAVHITKEGIEPFVYDEIKQFQQICLADICYNNWKPSGTICSSCCTENVVVCPTNRICNVGRGTCSYHKSVAKRYLSAGCPNQICHNLRNDIRNAHRYFGPSYKNTDATQWCTNPWEVAKCFMPPDGYKDVTSPAETDFNGIINVILNYTDFQTKISDNLSSRTSSIFEKGRNTVNAVRHSPSLEIEDADLQQYFTDLQNILSDSTFLASNNDALNSRRKLTKLQNDTLVVDLKTLQQMLEDIAKYVLHDIKEAKDDLNKESAKRQLELINDIKDSVKATEKTSLIKINDALKFAVSEIERKSKDAIFEAKMEMGCKKLEKVVDDGCNQIRLTKEADFSKHDDHMSDEKYMKLKEETRKSATTQLHGDYQRMKEHKMKQIISEICSELAGYCENIVLVYEAVTQHETDRKLVCLTSEESRMIPEYVNGYKVIQKPFYPTSKESIKAENAAQMRTIKEQNKSLCNDIMLIEQTISHHAETLMKKHTNLEAIRMSLVCSTKAGIENNSCIVLYCRCKGYIPAEETEFPRMLQHPELKTSFRTDVREGYFTLGTNGQTITRMANEWNKEIAMGCSIGPDKERCSATVGPFVNVKETNEICLLTVRHLFLPLDKPHNQVIGTSIFQPADGDIIVPINQQGQRDMPSRLCGTVVEAEMNTKIDASLIKISHDRLPSRGNFVGISKDDLDFAGFTVQQYPVFDDGSIKDATKFTGVDHGHDRVIKFGKKTGLTKGSLRISKMTVKHVTFTGSIQHGGSSQQHTLTDQLQVDSFAIKTFFQEGDSGSAVFLVDKNNKLHCIGMAIGVMSDLTCVVTPIQVILQELGAKMSKTLELKSFTHEAMDI